MRNQRHLKTIISTNTLYVVSIEMSKHNQNVDIFETKFQKQLMFQSIFLDLISSTWYQTSFYSKEKFSGVFHCTIKNYVACIHNYLQHLIAVEND